MIVVMDDCVQLWSTCLSEIESQTTKANFSTWFKNTSIQKIDGGVVFIGVPNEFVKEWMLTKYQKLILKTIVDHADYVRGIEFTISRVSPSVTEKISMSRPNELPLQDIYINHEDNLNPRYTFDRFVVGPFNELAYAAAQAVVRRPTQSYNPLFIYGGSGLGKTHLIQAVGNEARKVFPDKKVLYTTLEKFSNDYVAAVQNNRQQTFREKYRKYDLLIIDDIQFVSTKQSTQNELFHVFNTLYEQGKNIVFSSDKHPNHIIGLEDRLKTRFSAGMTIDIHEPDMESRLAIIRKKVDQVGIAIPEEVLSYIASVVTGSIRELEGALNIILMHSELKQKPISVSEVKTLIRNSIRPKKNISVDSVVKTVSDYYNLDERMIYEKTRRKEIVHARQIIMFMLREDFNESYPSIGAKLGGKDHTTVIHSYEKIKNDLISNPTLMKEIEDIRILFK
ncbi:MAG TPA: chromosomal replication initiator protein DnaA [Candidatus Paceibacterota bacterium]|nr:chromosomal replication initiator protein DnaA [Candidatus Paceibacterota bacterium]